MEFKQKVFSNGLQLVGEVNPSAKSAAVGFFVKTGSRDETENISGVSHFLEHMLFKGTDTLSALDVNEAFDSTGAQFNAFTSEENTIYYAAILPEYLDDITSLWIQLMRPALRDDDFDLEKNVIKEEIAMYKDLPHFDVMDRCRTLHFESHPCGNSILGTEQSIDALSSTQMRAYFKQRYAPNNIVVAWAGDIDWDRISALTESKCSYWASKDVSRSLSHAPGSRKYQRVDQAKLVREHICLMSEGLSAQDSRRYAAMLLAVIVGDDVGSRYYWELVDKALAEGASMQFSPMDGTGSFLSYIRCSPENVDQVMDIVGRLFKDLKEQGVTEQELDKAKNKILSALVIKNELPMGRLIDLGFNWIYLHKYRPIAEDVRAVKDVTLNDVNTLIGTLEPDRFTRFSIGP